MRMLVDDLRHDSPQVARALSQPNRWQLCRRVCGYAATISAAVLILIGTLPAALLALALTAAGAAALRPDM